MTEKLEHCPVCESASFSSFLSCQDYTVTQETFEIVTCENCDFKFTNPRPDEVTLPKYYQSEEYISHSNKNNSLIHLVYKQARNFTIRKKVKLINRIGKKGTVLDVGCGTGEFLSACKSDGWKIEGVEPSQVAVNQLVTLLKQGVYNAIFDIVHENLADVITMWHVLEHVPDLNKTIEKINALLKNDGTLIIAVPNYPSYDAAIYKELWAAYDVPRHLYHFDKNVMKNLLGKHSLEIKEILPMKLDSYYVSLLSEKYKNGKNNYISAIVNGYKSNKWAKRNNGEYSSLIYIIKKNG